VCSSCGQRSIGSVPKKLDRNLRKEVGQEKWTRSGKEKDTGNKGMDQNKGIRGTIGYGLRYVSGSEVRLQRYTDSDWEH
jgi:hypothetical protein